jgi:starch-binding outer membrane protein, SusD/RagB family
LNTPAATGGGGAGFFCPTYYFVNQFKTDANGLPVSNPQDKVVLDPAGQAGYTQYTGNVDPRLDWTIGRNQVPYHDWGTALTSWQRDPSAGPFLAKKTMIRQSQVAATHDASIWFVAGGTALNVNLIRFSDVILLLAEAEVEVGSLTEATRLVNLVRDRAANTRVVTFPTTVGAPKAGKYTADFASKDAGRAAVRLERLLELGLEGHRFFDLVRWNIAATELNAYYAYESAFPYQVLLKNPVPSFTTQKYYPVPQQQIDLGNGFIVP